MFANKKYLRFVFFRDASGAVGCGFTAKFTETGYSAVESVIHWLTESTYQMNILEANDSKITYHLFPFSIASANRSRKDNISDHT